MCKDYTCKGCQGPKGKGPGFWLSLVLGVPAPSSLQPVFSAPHPHPSQTVSASLPHTPHACHSPSSAGRLFRATEDNKVPRLLAPLEARPLLLRKVRSWAGGVGGVGFLKWGWSSWIPLMRPHYGQGPAGLLPPVPMARARESHPARAACSGHPAQLRAARAQSPPWVEVDIWASWVTGPSWSQWPS